MTLVKKDLEYTDIHPSLILVADLFVDPWMNYLCSKEPFFNSNHGIAMENGSLETISLGYR
jgi:hypothetical protein